MDNIASVVEVTVANGKIVPCIKTLRGIDIASRYQHAVFSVHVSFSYHAAGVVVNIPENIVLMSLTVGEEGHDPVWRNFDLPAIAIPAPPDPNTQFTCNAKITITGPTGIVTDMGYLDTALVSPSAPD